MVPTLGTLATISRVYGVALSYFFNEPTRHTISITRKAHLQGHDHGSDHARVIPLNAASSGAPLSSPAPGSASPRLSAQMIELPAGGVASISNLFHQSSGLVYVLDGKLQLDSGGLQELLDTGDCAYIESNMALSWSAAGKQRCRLLAVSPGLAASHG
jgi:quercetin dioxygenase-like cupin family protein